MGLNLLSNIVYFVKGWWNQIENGKVLSTVHYIESLLHPANRQELKNNKQPILIVTSSLFTYFRGLNM